LQEIDEHWTICDLADAHEVLDIKEEYEAYMMRKSQSKQ
jgi:hypothetical protein